VEEEPFVPTEFGRYHLVDKLAKGGMAEIFMAKSHGAHGFEKTLVVKRILPQLASDPEFVEMFIDEAKVMVKINHPKVVQVLDFGEVDKQYYIAMEYVQGVDGLALLRMCVRRGVRPTTYIAVHVVAEVLDALHYAHTLLDETGAKLGIVHRDISPSNIFISDQGEVKLGDFGIARAAVRTQSTESRNLKGKYGYLAPEVVSGADVDQRSDIFSAGVVLAELLMVRRLFVAKSDLEVLLQVRDARLDRLDRYGKHIPDDLRTILESALARDPDLRYQDAATFRDALHRYLYDHRRMVRHTDVRRFLRRLQGEEETDEHEIFGTLSAMGSGGTPGESEQSTAMGKKAEALAREADTATKDPSDELAAAVQASEERPPATSKGPPPPPPQKRRRVPTVEAHQVDEDTDVGLRPEDIQAGKPKPVPEPASPHDPPPMRAEKPSGSTEYSANLRERITIRPGKRPKKRAKPLHFDASSSEWATAPGSEGQAEELGNEEDSKNRPPTVGRKRKINVGPPPAPEPVPEVRTTTGEEDALTLDGVLDLLQESEQMGSDSGWDRSYPNKTMEPMVMPGVVTPEADADRARVAAAQVSTDGDTPSGDKPDLEGELSTHSPISIVFGLALAEETGMLSYRVEGTVKEIYFTDGDPQSVASNRPEELFGQYLVNKAALSEGELAMALAMLDHFNGKLGDALVALKLMRPVQVLRHLTQQVREKLQETMTWTKGSYAFYRGRILADGAAPVGLDSFEILGSAASELPGDFVAERLNRFTKAKLKSVSSPTVPPEVFRMGGQARELFDQLDGRHTLEQVQARFDDPEAALVQSRIILLLLETGLVKRGSSPTPPPGFP